MKAERKVKVRAWSSSECAALHRAITVFETFSPTTKPVLWRILMTQAINRLRLTLDLIRRRPPCTMWWARASTFSHAADDKSVDTGLAAAEAYLSSHVG
jgi:hypothetical protein